MASAASPTQDLVMATITNCLWKFLWAPKMAWYHCSKQMVSFSLSVPEDQGIPGILFKMGWTVVHNATGPVAELW